MAVDVQPNYPDWNEYLDLKFGIVFQPKLDLLSKGKKEVVDV